MKRVTVGPRRTAVIAGQRRVVGPVVRRTHSPKPVFSTAANTATTRIPNPLTSKKENSKATEQQYQEGGGQTVRRNTILTLPPTLESIYQVLSSRNFIYPTENAYYFVRDVCSRDEEDRIRNNNNVFFSETSAEVHVSNLQQAMECFQFETPRKYAYRKSFVLDRRKKESLGETSGTTAAASSGKSVDMRTNSTLSNTSSSSDVFPTCSSPVPRLLPSNSDGNTSSDSEDCHNFKQDHQNHSHPHHNSVGTVNSAIRTDSDTLPGGSKLVYITLSEGEEVFHRLTRSFWPGNMLLYAKATWKCSSQFHKSALFNLRRKMEKDSTETNKKLKTVKEHVENDEDENEDAQEEEDLISYTAVRLPSHPLTQKILCQASAPYLAFPLLNSVSGGHCVSISDVEKSIELLLERKSPASPNMTTTDHQQEEVVLNDGGEDEVDTSFEEHVEDEYDDRKFLIINGEEKREIFSVPCCTAESVLEIVLDEESREVVIFDVPLDAVYKLNHQHGHVNMFSAATSKKVSDSRMKEIIHQVSSALFTLKNVKPTDREYAITSLLKKKWKVVVASSFLEKRTSTKLSKAPSIDEGAIVGQKRKLH